MPHFSQALLLLLISNSSQGIRRTENFVKQPWESNPERGKLLTKQLGFLSKQITRGKRKSKSQLKWTLENINQM